MIYSKTFSNVKGIDVGILNFLGLLVVIKCVYCTIKKRSKNLVQGLGV